MWGAWIWEELCGAGREERGGGGGGGEGGEEREGKEGKEEGGEGRVGGRGEGGERGGGEGGKGREEKGRKSEREGGRCAGGSEETRHRCGVECDFTSLLLSQGKETRRVKLADTEEVLEMDETDLEKVGHVTVR